MKREYFLFHILPGALFAGLVLLFGLSMAVSRIQPQILSVEPSRVSPGDLMILKGKNFGIARGKSKVYLDQTPLTASFIESWSDDHLKVRVPPVNRSGLISVETSGGRSRGALFILSERVPDLASGAFLPGKPFLSGINKSRFQPGELIVLEGDKMGMRKKNSRILVSLSGRAPEGVLDQPDETNFLEVAEDHILSWEDKGLSFYLPEEAKSGPVYLKTASGYSNPISIEVVPAALPEPGESRTVTLRQEIRISHVAALPGNGLALNIPEPRTRPGQTLLSRSSELEGDVVLQELESLSSKSIINDYTLSLEEISYDLEGVSLPSGYENAEMLEPWLKEEAGLPVSDLKRTALAVIKRERRPAEKGKLIFDYMLWKMHPDLENPETDPSAWLKTRKTDDKGYAALFVTLCRGAGIPARVVRGVWLSPGAREGRPHSWTEIYLPGIGWFPADPGAADGILEDLQAEDAPVPGGWGRLDEGYVAFSRGPEHIASRYDRGREGSAPAYALRDRSSEFLGNLDSCSISWENIAIMAQ